MWQFEIRIFCKLFFVFYLGIISCDSNKTNANHDQVETGEQDTYAKIYVIDSINLLKTQADILIGKEDFLSALELFEKLILIDSLNGKFHFEKGYCLAQLNSDVEAINCYLKASELNYNRFECYRSLGIIYSIKLGNKEKAKYYFEKCVEINPNNDEVKDLLNSLEIKPKSKEL